MWINSLLMAVIGLSAGFTVAAGLGAFMIELGVISDFADRTHTGEHVLLMKTVRHLAAFWEICFIFIR